MSKPEFIDNQGGNTLARALKSHLEWIEKNFREPVELSIATGYFNPDGFALTAKHLEKLSRVRMIIGAEPVPPPLQKPRMPGEPRGERYEAAAISKALEDHSNGLRRDRDLLGFSPEVDSSVKSLLGFLNTGKFEVRRYEKRFLHGKAFIFSNDEGVIAGSSNFTAAGLTSNLELNMGRYDPSPVRQVSDWFENLWKDSVRFDLASIYSSRYEDFDPYLVYLRVLWERYGDEVTDESASTGFKLTTFQKDGVLRARRILDEYNGVVFADGVGLGKTFIGADLIQEAQDEKGQRALLIAPAALRDGTWERFSDLNKLYIERISFEQLAGESKLGGSKGSYLKESPEQYSLIVVDEAQAFRNPDTDRARALRTLLRGKRPKKLVLLSATPVNNSLWDLYYLMTYFIGHDAIFADRGIISLSGVFKLAMAEDPFSLRPDMLFDVLDATCVRRTRHFIQKYYPYDKIKGLDGKEVVIRFPKPRVKSINYDLDSVIPDFFKEFEKALMPSSGEPGLTMARYSPTNYLKNKKIDMNEKVALARELALVGLVRTMLLKRLESSPHSLAETLERMIASNEAFLASLKKGYIPKPKVIEEWEEVDSDEALEDLLKEAGSEKADAYNVKKLSEAVRRDLKTLGRFQKIAASVEPEADPKLKQLRTTLIEVLASATRDGKDAEDVGNKRKVIVFSYFEDTLIWIRRWLDELLVKDKALAPYRGRLAFVSGGELGDENSREKAIYGFAPDSSEAPAGKDEDRFDILLTTDVLAEGQNLQQCRNIVNYDLPWNPMRLVQRHGRIDRIGSHHDEVFIRCFLPDRRLDDLLGLEERIRKKLAQAAATIGVESEVIPKGATSEIVFADTRKEIEALQKGDATLFVNAGEDPDAHSGEEYRQELRHGLEKCGDEIRNLPWAAGSGFRKGKAKGHFFCARIGDRPFMRFVPGGKADIVRETLQCLRMISCTEKTERVVDDGLLRRVYDAWNVARRDIFNEWTKATDPKKLQPKIRPLFRQVADHLRKHGPAGTTLTDLNMIIDAVEAPWGIRIERQIREVFEKDGLTPSEISRQMCDKVMELGLRPYHAPKPLPTIGEDDVHLICWLIVS